jgi:hypothetical protein
MRYTGYATTEVGAKDKDEAIAKAAAFMDRYSRNRKKPAAERYDFYRVRKIGRLRPGFYWFVVYYRHKRAAKKGAKP